MTYIRMYMFFPEGTAYRLQRIGPVLVGAGKNVYFVVCYYKALKIFSCSLYQSRIAQEKLLNTFKS